MIVLDTNVVSEIMKPPASRSGRVFAWLQSYSLIDVFTTTITLGEVLAGIAMLPEGKRRSALQEALRNMASTVFPERILPFDEAAAVAFVDVMANRRKKGLSFEALDMQIAGIAKSRRLAVATRNANDFEDCGVQVIDPWSE
jgi:toxin FitB